MKQSSQKSENSTHTTSSPSETKGLRVKSSRFHKLRRRTRLRKLCSGGSSKWRTRKSQIKQCRLLKSHVFSKCRRTVKVGKYFRWCIEDACACPTSGKCHCESLMAYARRCEEEANILVDWRQHSSCREVRTCPTKGGVFSSCAPPPECLPACGKNFITASCSRNGCLPGCVCPTNTVLHGNKCVQPELCP